MFVGGYPSLVVGRCNLEGVINTALGIALRGINKPVAIPFDIDLLYQKAFGSCPGVVFDQDAARAIKPPHFESCPENAAPWKELIEVRHGVETIDRDLV